MFDYSNNERTAGSSWYSEMARYMKIYHWALATDRETLAESLLSQMYEWPLSICVRDGWRQPHGVTDEYPEEFEILLGTGGPAVRIYGTLDHHGEPYQVQLQNQDWGSGWQQVKPNADLDKRLEQYDTLKQYAYLFSYT